LKKIEFAYSFFWLYDLDVEFRSRHSLSAGGPGSLLGAFAPAGSPLDAFFPQESRAFLSNQLWFNF
jgi:hypothetical protein